MQPLPVKFCSYSNIDLTLTNNSLDCEVQIARTKDFRIAGIVSIVTLLSPLSCFRTWDLHNVTY